MTNEPSLPVAVVTGGGREIGKASAQRLAADGFHVVILELDETTGKSAQEEIVAKGGSAESHVVDVTDRGQVFAAFAGVLERTDRIDVVVNNAMWLRYVPIQEVDEDLLDGMLAIGLKAAFWTIQASYEAMKSRGTGTIINISSPAADRGPYGSSVYSAVKGAVKSLTLQAARELGPQGIRVNAVVPGAVPTVGAKTVVDDEGYELRRQLNALKRLAQPEDIAAAISFLASEDASYINGHLLAVDGGL
ncbi:SDR family NAD(P)-dependent oxidoreductase [Arthrobacter sp. YN]|uniref:SDR family NAD(P)-dependent oxidoreductase n=1 Tax=Arthrobacter sp. YN TaxID=2020486 RepID=UPI0012FD5EDD|nr:SDR family oxidoreductase [Arthrobacter sp. YN]